MLPNVVVVWLIKTPSWSRDMKLDFPTAESPAKMILNVRSAGPVGSQSSRARKPASLFSLIIGWKWLNFWDGLGEDAARCNSLRKEAEGCGNLKLRLKEPDLSSPCSFCSFSKSELWPLSKIRRWNGLGNVIHFQWSSPPVIGVTSSSIGSSKPWPDTESWREDGRVKRKPFNANRWITFRYLKLFFESLYYQQATFVEYRNLRGLLENRWYPEVGD